MHRRTLLFAPLLPIATSACVPGRWALVTPQEAEYGNGAPPSANRGVLPGTRGLAASAGPAIVVEQPDVGKPLHAPLSFRVRFVPVTGTPIDPSSFRAIYGFLGLDITDRLLRHARLDSQTLTAENVDVPAGIHTVTIMIADLLGRQASRTFQFTVV
jgi:hypothetical protein